jgi:hypothetical protein
MNKTEPHSSPITKVDPQEDPRATRIAHHGFVLMKHHKDARRYAPEHCDPDHFDCSPSLPSQETIERNLR